MPGQIGWFYSEISGLKSPSSFGLMSILILRRTFRTISSLGNWTIPFCCFLQEKFYSFRIGINCIFSFLMVFHLLRWIAPKCPHYSGSCWFHHDKIAMRQQSRSWKPVFKWTSLIDFTLHFSQHDGNRGVVQTLVLLSSKVLVSCWIGMRPLSTTRKL